MGERVPGQLWVDEQLRVSPESCVIFSDNPIGLHRHHPIVIALKSFRMKSVEPTGCQALSQDQWQLLWVSSRKPPMSHLHR